MEYSLQAIDDPNLTDLHWRQFHAFLTAMHARGLGYPTSSSWEALKTRNLERLAVGDGLRQWILWHGERVAGWQVLHPRGATADGRKIVVLAFNFEPEVDSVQVARAMASEVLATMDRHGYGAVHSTCPDAHLDAVRRIWGGEVLGKMVKYRLDRKTAGIESIDRWLAEFPARFPELRLEIYTELPDRHIDAWLALFRQFMDEMPNEGGPPVPFSMTREEVIRLRAFRAKNQQYLYTAALFDKTGRMIGHSNVQTAAFPPVEWHQAMTGIDRVWRGKGLSKWLKAALFVRTGQDFPECRFIVTEMRSVNEPILAVNRAMGFEKVGEGCEWSIDLETLKLAIRPHRA